MRYLIVTFVFLSMFNIGFAADNKISPPSAYPEGKLGELVKLGEDLMNNTNVHELTKRYVGNDLTCTSCHLEAGKTSNKYSTFIGTAAAFPAYAPREKAVITLEERILNCFMRSMNGTRPPVGSKASIAMTTYITWLSEGYTIKMNTIKPVGINNLPFPLKRLKIMLNKADTKNGNKLYGEKCSECHGENGQGADNGPPVWGAKSYNMGAGLSNNLKLASWLIFNMPIEELGLSDKDAVDIATYINSNSRPDFVLKEHLPNENKLGVYNTNQ